MENFPEGKFLMADKGQGIALQPFSYVESFWKAVNHVKDGEQK